MNPIENLKIGFIGLGYAGLPTACLLAEKYPLIGYDIKAERVEHLLSSAEDKHINHSQIHHLIEKGMMLTSDEEQLRDCNFYIIVVPTPIDFHNRPDLSFVTEASKTVGKYLKKDDIVVYESTVYPGATEEVCVPVLEEASHLRYNEDFFVGYSPERIVPEDTKHTVANIIKITSGSTPESAKFIDQVYSSVLENGTCPVSSIRVAEAAKVIENAQRDVNIAFVNEIAKVLNSLKLDTNEVIDAAATKWNFLDFRPGLVGGHCISVDPYYLISKASHVGVSCELMKSARNVNNSMAQFIANQVIVHMGERNVPIADSKILLLGCTFKENCPDVRNTKVIDIFAHLAQYTNHIDIYDPIADAAACHDYYGVNIKEDISELSADGYQAIVLCVSHEEFKTLDYEKLKGENAFIYDVKGFLDKNLVDYRL